MKTIEVLIDEYGDTSVDLGGFQGQGCAKVMDDFAGGAKAKVERNKREFSAPAKQEDKQTA